MLPKLRPLSITPSEDGFVVRDPYGVSEDVLWVSRAAMAVASLLDGAETLEAFHAHVEEVAGREVPIEKVLEVIETFERAGFLDTAQTKAALFEAERHYVGAPFRPMAHDGRAFPADPGECEQMLQAFRSTAVLREPAGPLTGLILPHLELCRVPEVYGAALNALTNTPAPVRVLIIGVAHQPISEVAAGLALDLETPLGRLQVDHEALAALDALLPFDLFNSPLAFRHEHSIEFPAVLLASVWPQAPFKVLPLLVGGVAAAHDLAQLVSAIQQLNESHPFFPLASVDLSHVGERFGDGPLDDAMEAAAGEIDRAYLAAIAARQFERAIASVIDTHNPSRIDAYASVHALHRTLVGKGEVLAYTLSVEAENASAVGAGVIAFQ